jgi:biotin carboxylase
VKSEELKGKRLAVFGANNVTDEVTAFARRHGVVLISVGNVPEAPIHQVTDEQYYLDCTDEDAILPFFKEKHIDGLLSCSGEMVIRKSVGFISKTNFHYYATPNQWDVLMNKQHFKVACHRYGIPAIPAFRMEDADIPFPVIVKPVDNGGSFGITVCHNHIEMKQAISKAVQNSTAGEYLCEKFLEGPYFQFEIWRQNGKSYFPYTKGRVFYDAIGQSPRQPFIDLYPSPEADVIAQLYEPISLLFDDLGVNDGSCMFQGIISDGVPYIMDCAFRLSGGMDFRVVNEDKGIDLVACYMQHALTGQFGGDFSSLSEHLHDCYATLCIGLKNGRISCIRGIDTVKELPYVFSLFQYYHEGDTMQHSGNFLQVLCRIFVRADNLQEVQQNINVILKLIKVEGDNGQSLLLDYTQPVSLDSKIAVCTCQNP